MAQATPAADRPVFDKVAVVGLGLIGGSIAMAVRRRWPSGLVIGVDERPILEQAMALHAVDVGADDPVVLAEADLIILAAPVRENIALLGRLADHVRVPAVVTDVGSTKRAIAEAARRLPPGLSFIGGHPLAGAARGGVAFARPDLFAGRPWVLTPDRDEGEATLERLRAFVAALGALPRSMTPEDHDRLLASLSHLPQLAASALMHVVGEATGADGLALAGAGLVDTTRLASSPAGTWLDICATNADQIRPALDRLIRVLGEVREDLLSGQAIERLFDSAAGWRRHLPDRGDRDR